MSSTQTVGPSCSVSTASSATGRSPGSATESSSSASAPAGMRRPSRRWSKCTGRWCWAFAAGFSATHATSRTPSRRLFSSWCGKRRKSATDVFCRAGSTVSPFGWQRELGRTCSAGAAGSIPSATAEFASTPDSHDMLGLGPVLDQELSRLPAKYRAPLVLCYLRGRTHDQAASELCCPVGTVRSRMARGRDLLKRRLTGRGCAPNAALFGLGLDEPSRLLTAALPERLVAVTVDAAIGTGSTHTIEAGAALAPALALTQGVVTSMKFAQLKWIGLLHAWRPVFRPAGPLWSQPSRPRVPARRHRESRPLQPSKPPQEASAGTPSTSTSTAASGSSKTTEQRLLALEQQIDRIYRLNGITRDTGGPGISSDAPTLDRVEAKLLFLISKHDDEQPTGTGTASGTQHVPSPDDSQRRDDCDNVERRDDWNTTRDQDEHHQYRWHGNFHVRPFNTQFRGAFHSRATGFEHPDSRARVSAQAGSDRNRTCRGASS